MGRIATDYLGKDQACLLFITQNSAQACRDFALSDNRKEIKCEHGEVQVRAFDGHVRIWATCFPAVKMRAVMPYWQDPGTGISSRIAQDVLAEYSSLKEVEVQPGPDPGLSQDSAAYNAIKSRMVDLLNTRPTEHRPAKVKSGDVFLYQTGMAAIYRLHGYLQNSSIQPGSTVLFGFAFHSSPNVYREYSSNFKWLGRGDEQQLKELEEYCSTEAGSGRPVQSVWIEFPTNPNLKCVELKRLRALADKFGFLLVVDDTISSFCNVDLLGIADVLVTSLTKSFSGYADVMGGSVVLNPNAKQYELLKALCDKNFVNEYYSKDAEVMERNSRDYLQRSKTLNDNALALARYLYEVASNASSPITKIGYPGVGPDEEIYQAFMRPASSEFQPGFGCLLNIEFESVETTIAFYDDLKVHDGPHLGAPLTLALPYVKVIHRDDVAWVEECGLNERMIRISVGLEETKDLLDAFKEALEAANAAKSRGPLEKAINPMGP